MIFEDDYGAFLFLLPIFLIIFDTEDRYFYKNKNMLKNVDSELNALYLWYILPCLNNIVSMLIGFASTF